MRIGVDALPLLGKLGLRTYLYYLLKHLLNIDHNNPYHLFFRAFRRRISEADYFRQFSNVSFHKIPVPNRILESFWTKKDIYIPFTQKLFKDIDIYFSPDYFSPIIKNCAVLSLVCDLTPLKYQIYKREQQFMFELRLKNTLRRSHIIIAISESTKNDLLNYSPIEPDTIQVIPLAVDESFRQINEKHQIRKVLRKYNIDREYILYVGNLGLHKNSIALVRVFDKAKRVYKIPHKLVLCGPTWATEVMETVHRLNIEDEVIITGYVPDEDLLCIYNGADLFVFISLYEGFGLPPLEAMACGIPVIASNTSSLPEVIGDAGILVNPLNEDEILQSIMKVLKDTDLRETLKNKSVEQAKKFSWDKTAKKTLDVFYKAIENR